jgi:hypothetical protein
MLVVTVVYWDTCVLRPRVDGLDAKGIKSYVVVKYRTIVVIVKSLRHRTPDSG